MRDVDGMKNAECMEFEPQNFGSNLKLLNTVTLAAVVPPALTICARALNSSTGRGISFD